jgi:L-alanine-DL-glutamate epimerase-like enolase superfamily enzyme
VRYLTPTLAGRAAQDIGGALTAMDGRMYGNHGAKAAIEIALHDLVGRATDRPAHALLGDRQRSRMTILGVIGGGDLDGDLRDAGKKKDDGFTAFKIKVGVDTPAADAQRTRRICAILPPGALISADANQGFSAQAAIAFVRAVAGCGLDFFEQPVAADDLAGMAAVAAATDVAIGADEGIHSAADIRRHHERNAARGVSLKAIKLGGMRAVVEAARLCERLGMHVNVSCKTGESSIACAAALHVAAVIPAIAWGLTLTNAGLGDDVTAHPIRIHGGRADVLDRPGLGIDVDEDRVLRHRVEIAARHAPAR